MTLSSCKRNQPQAIDKFIAISCYFTLIGWLIALILYGKYKSPLARFHLRQSLGLFLLFSLFSFIPLIGWLLLIPVIIAWAVSLYSAFLYQRNMLPVLGDSFQKHLSFII